MAGRHEWYRNEHWSAEIEKQFDGKLKRARTQGPQYLRIQAHILAKREPRVALRLLERYFATGDSLDMAAALQAQGEALEALGSIEESVEGYRKAMEWEEAHPQIITTTYVALPHMIASRRLSIHYDLAMKVLQLPYRNPSYSIPFPYQIFLHAYALAVIHRDQGRQAAAVEQAKRALEAAAMTVSPFPRRRGLGLVADSYRPEIDELRKIVGPDWKETLRKRFRRLARNE